MIRFDGYVRLNIRCLLLLVMALVVIPAHAVALNTNLQANSGFEGAWSKNAPTGWGALWTRVAGAGSMALDAETRHAGAHALCIRHQGAQDWAVSSTAKVPVEPGDLFALSAWVRYQDLASGAISVVTYQENGTAVNWQYGGLNVSGTHAWRALARQFVVPLGCTAIQLRLTGAGQGTLWVDDVALAKVGHVNLQNTRPLTLTNDLLKLQLDPVHGALTVTDKRNGRVWIQHPLADMVLENPRVQSATQLAATVHDLINGLALRATITLKPGAPEVTVTLDGSGDVTRYIAFPHPFVTGAGTALVLPINEGILFPVDDASIPPMQLAAYSGHGLSMPWYGVTDSATGAGVMTILRTPDDARVDLTRQANTGLYAAPLWDASRGTLRYARTLSYRFYDQGGYVAQAKGYRDHARQAGLLKTLQQKRQENPNVDRLVGAANVWNWDSDKVALCAEMRALGMERVLWSNGDNPDHTAEINAQGYLTGRYDNYQDVWGPDAPAALPKSGWPDDLVLKADGSMMEGWTHYATAADGGKVAYPGGVRCSKPGLERARAAIPRSLAKYPYTARFFDTITASPWRECYNPRHPLTRTQDRANKMALLAFAARQQQVVGAETGIDPSVPYVDYYEGMMSLGPYRLPDAGRDLLTYKAPTPDFLKFQVGAYYRIPLWELVYHDCAVSYWYWGDASNKVPEVWDRRDLLNMLYATPPMFVFDHAAWEQSKARFVQSYTTVAPVARALGYQEMLAHDFLTPDHAVQRTRWQSGTEVLVNFGPTAYTTPDGAAVPPMGSLTRPIPTQASRPHPWSILRQAKSLAAAIQNMTSRLTRTGSG